MEFVYEKEKTGIIYQCFFYSTVTKIECNIPNEGDICIR